VRIHLDYLQEASLQRHTKLFGERMKSYLCSFSYRFELVDQLQCNLSPEENELDHYRTYDAFRFRFPSDVKISYRHSLIILSDSGNKRLQLFDLETRQHRATIKLLIESCCICVEENYGNCGSDAIIVTTCDHCIQKYDLLSLKLLWSTGKGKPGCSDSLFNIVRGVTICNKNDKAYQYLVDQDLLDCNDSLVLVCDSGNQRVIILRSSDGKVLRSFYFSESELEKPWGICFTDLGQLVICGKGSPGSIIICYTMQSGYLNITKRFEVSGYGVNEDENRLVVTCKDCMVVIDSRNGDIQFSKPNFVTYCINKYSGECIAIADGLVLIYK